MAEDPEERHWPEILRRAETDGAAGVAAWIAGFDAEARPKLYAFARRALSQREWKGKSFDEILAVARAGIEDALALARDATSPEAAWKLTEHANIVAFDMSADLCECWPGDEAKRERKHIETGLRLAEDCVRWRRELGKPPERRALAYWAVGMHHVSLGNPSEAHGAFVAAAELVEEDLKAAGKPAAVEPGGDFARILYDGYAALARMIRGEAAAREGYDRACGAFERTVAEFPDKKDDAQFGLDQLRWVETRFLSGRAA